MRSYKAPVRDALLAILRQSPDGMSYGELAEDAEMTYTKVVNAIAQSRKLHGPEHFYISGWRAQRGNAGSISPLWKAGPGKDYGRPKLSKRKEKLAKQKRYRDSHREQLRAKDIIRRGRAKPLNPFSGLLISTRNQTCA